MKQKFKKFTQKIGSGLAQELKETKDIPRHLKEKNFKAVAQQLADIIKMMLLALIWLLPAGIAVSGFIVKYSNKMRPTAFRKKENKMRIAIIGLGGVGGYISASLAKSGYNVVGFARGQHLWKIQKNGIKIIEDSKTWITPLDARILEDADGYFDVVLFCVKSYDLQISFEEIKPFTNSKTIMLSFSNGVSNGDILRSLSDSIVLDACIYILSHIEDAGVIRKEGKVFATVFGGDENATKTLKSVFEEANLRVKTPADIKTAIWKKYIFISAYATLTSYYDSSIAYVNEQHYDEAKELLTEIADVAKAKGIDIEDEIEKSLQTASKLPYDSSTSMRLDFQSRKKTELESLSAYIVKEGLLHGVKTPLMEKMYKELEKREKELS